ncbi:MAG: S8 family serine peptidase [Lachnospiraceae bacterium]|nr:S8 family serine peptidase [Lachnospiraceae bacterium]
MRKKQFIAACMAMVMGISSVTMPTAVRAEESTQEYVVMTEDKITYEEVLEVYDDKIVTEEEIVGEEAQTQEFLEEANMTVLELTETEVMRLEKDKDILFVEEDILFEGSFVEVEPDYIEDKDEVFDASGEQWNLKAIHWNAEQVGGETMSVALLDSGVMWHDDIDVAADIRLVPGDEDISDMYMDPMGHGTGIASIIAGKINGEGINGINPNTEIYSIQILNDSNQSSLSRVVSGIYRAIEEDCKIINMSFGTTVYSDILYKAVCDAYDAGILMIAAAGNHPGVVEYPAAFPEVMAVGATTAEGIWMKGTANGEEIEILAPGDQIITDGPWDGVYVNAGTSLSSAQVTGAASLLWSKNSEKPADYIRKLLVSTAQTIEGTKMSAGVLDIENAIKEMYNYAESYEKNPIVHTEYRNVTEDAEIFETEGLVNGSYGNTAHEKIVDYAKDTASVNLSDGSIYITIMKLAAKQADQKDAEALRDKKTVDEASAEALKALKNSNALEDVTMKSNSELKLVKAVKRFPESYGYKKKYYYVLGLITHLIGDVYAHQSMVPESKISALNSTWFKEADSACAVCNSDKTIKKYAADSKKYCDNICRHRKAYKRAIKLDVMATSDLKQFVKKTKQEDVNKKYIDSTEFMNERFQKAKKVSRKILNRFHMEYGFHAVKIYITSDTKYNVRLNGLKKFMADIGCKTDLSEFGDYNWNNYSTPNRV